MKCETIQFIHIYVQKCFVPFVAFIRFVIIYMNLDYTNINKQTLQRYVQNILYSQKCSVIQNVVALGLLYFMIFV